MYYGGRHTVFVDFADLLNANGNNNNNRKKKKKKKEKKKKRCSIQIL